MKSLFILLFCITCIIPKAQIPFSDYLDNTCEWYYYMIGNDGLFTTESYITYYIDGDTFANNNYYYKRYYDRIDSTSSFQFGTNTVDTTTRTLYDLVREDSLKRFFRLSSPNSDDLLFDFNLSLNDTFTNSSCTVFNIDTVTINNRALKWFLPEYMPYGKSGVIEGIGSARFYCGMMIHGDYSLVCFKKQNETLSIDSSKSCESFLSPSRLSTSLNPIDSKKNTLYYFPIPANKYLNVSFLPSIDNFISYQLYNHQGQAVFSPKEKMDDSFQINVEHLNSGIYFLRMTFTNSNPLTKRILIEH